MHGRYRYLRGQLLAYARTNWDAPLDGLSPEASRLSLGRRASLRDVRLPSQVAGRVARR